MSERTVQLRNMGRWEDEVGKSFEKVAVNCVNNFNSASTSLWQRIERIESYSESDVQYDSQRNNLLQMRAEYHG